jgi:hypothetical protein
VPAGYPTAVLEMRLVLLLLELVVILLVPRDVLVLLVLVPSMLVAAKMVAVAFGVSQLTKQRPAISFPFLHCLSLRPLSSSTTSTTTPSTST